MSVFENFPYTNFHNLNLDWVLNKLKSFEERLNNIEKNGATGGTTGGNTGGTAPDITGLEAKINAKQDKLTFDTEPKNDSTNPVTSDGIMKFFNANFIKNKFKVINNESGFTLTANTFVKIDDSSISSLIPSTDYVALSNIVLICISIQIERGLVAQAVMGGPSLFRAGQGIGIDAGHMFASCYQDLYGRILNFDIRSSDDGTYVRWITSDNTDTTSTLHINGCVLNVMYYDWFF